MILKGNLDVSPFGNMYRCPDDLLQLALTGTLPNTFKSVYGISK